MRCNWPSCPIPAKYTPVVEIPCIRSRFVIPPIDVDEAKLLLSRGLLERFGLSPHKFYQQYEASVKDFEDGTVTVRSEPTILIGREVCQTHKDTYNLFNWIQRKEWAALREAARCHGVEMPAGELLVVKFMPVGWTPQCRLVMER